MIMKIINSEEHLCTCCMEKHEVKTVLVREQATFKNVKITYDAVYFYCDTAEGYGSRCRLRYPVHALL